MFSDRFDQLIKEFCNFVANRYHIDENEIFQLWKSSSSSSSSISSTSQPSQPATSKDSDSEITREKVMSGTKDMLSAMCKKAGLKQSGKKEELTTRLLEYLSSNSTSTSTSTTSSIPKPSQSKSGKKEDPPVVKAIKERHVELAIRKNSFGNFEHVQTGLVFGTDKIVCGRQLPDGKISDLSVDDIEVCKKYKFPYKVPENLNTSKNVDDVKIDEIDEEELDEEDIEEEVEEEEEEEEEEEN